MKSMTKEQNRKRGTAKEPCLYCGRPTLSRDYIINPGAEHELPSCSEECFEKIKRFVDYDSRFRMRFYMVLFVLVVANLFLLGFDADVHWRFLPMLCMSMTVFVCPLVFTRYERYQRIGIHKTKTVVRIIAAVLAVFSTALIIG